MSDDDAPRPTDLAASRARAEAYMNTLALMKGALDQARRGVTVKEEYDALREQYASGAIELEDFTAGIVQLLQRGL